MSNSHVDESTIQEFEAQLQGRLIRPVAADY